MRLAKSSAVLPALFGLLLVLFVSLASCSGGGAKKSPEPRRTTDLAGIAAEIAELETPDGVNPELFASLTNALFNQLKARIESEGITKFASAAPKGDAGKVTDLELDADTAMLRWSYTNVGDYDFSGETGIPDITPIALHYLAIVDDGEGDDLLEAWIDGDNSGDVGIPDITPIALNYLGTVFEYVLLEADEPEGEFTEVLRVPYEDVSEDLPKSFEIALPPGGKRYVTVQPVDRDGNSGETSNVVDTVDVLQKDLEIVQSSMTVSALIDGVTQRTINIRNNTESPIFWTLAKNQDWMTISAESGTTAGGEETGVDVTFYAAGLNVGTRTGRLTLDWEGGTDICGIVFRVVADGSLPIIEEDTIDFNADLGEVITQNIRIRNDGNQSLNWQLTANQPWLSFNPQSGILGPAADISVQVTANTGGLGAGAYGAVISLADDSDPLNKDTCIASLFVTDIGESLSHVTVSGAASGNGTSLDPWVFPPQATSVQFTAHGMSGKNITTNTLTKFELGGAVSVSPGTAFSEITKGRLIWGAFDTNVQVLVQFRNLPMPPQTYWIYKAPVEE